RGHARVRPGSDRPPVPADLARGRPQRRRPPVPGGRGRRGAGASPPYAGPVRTAARGDPVADRPRAAPARYPRGPGCRGVGRDSGAHLGRRAALQAAGAVPLPITVEPVGVIEPEPGSAKIKLVKSLDAPRPE